MTLRRAFVVSSFVAALAACGWDPARPFEREAPQVNEALGKYDAGEAGAAADLLQEYLQTGACKEGNIGTPLRVREKSNGSFDLGLALFKIAEAYGQRFGDEEIDGGPVDPNAKAIRTAHVDCALRVARAIGEDGGQEPSIRARARYLEGNLLFLNGDYKEAVTAYDHALEIIPGMGDAGPIGMDAGRATSGIGRDAAWNRAIALRRIEDKKDAGPEDAAPPQNDGGNQGDSGKNDDDKKDGGGESDSKDGGKNDKGKDGGNEEPPKNDPPQDEPDAGQAPPPPPSRQSQDDRILDQLENAPTVQQEAAKKQGRARKVRSMADK
jgi:tetratricopeptide (TPR) repeat protein